MRVLAIAAAASTAGLAATWAVTATSVGTCLWQRLHVHLYLQVLLAGSRKIPRSSCASSDPGPWWLLLRLLV